MKRLWIVLALLAAPLANAQQLVGIDERFLIAEPGKVRLVSRQGNDVWTAPGVASPSSVIAGRTRIAVLDAIHDEAAIYDIDRGTRTSLHTAATPIAGAFVGDALVIISRDARILEKFGRDGSRVQRPLGMDPTFLRRFGSAVVIYSRVDGRLQSFDGDTLAPLREAFAAPFASDLEIDGPTAYLTYPREATIRQFDLSTMKRGGELRVGSVPSDMDLASSSGLLSASSLAVADPGARRVWLIEGRQSVTQAFLRGFVRGLVGLGLFRGSGREFPSGVDRVSASRGRWIAYDSLSGTVYRTTKKGSTVVARGVAPGAWCVTANGVSWLDQDASVRTSPW
jgi:hypothetical protein